MARLFDDALSQYLEYAGAVVSDYPFSLACWYRSDSLTAFQAMIGIAGSAGSAGRQGLHLWGHVGGDPVVMYNETERAQSTIAYTANVWQHACGVAAASNSRAVYLNGGSKGTDTNVQTIGSLNRTAIGRSPDSTPSGYMSGELAELAIWGATLTDEEDVILAAGYSPLFVRPQSLVAYWPLIGRLSPEIDLVGGFDMVLYNGPTQADHPRIIYPSPAQMRAIAAAGVAAGIPRHWMHYARQRYG